jgi:hypothetical protein
VNIGKRFAVQEGDVSRCHPILGKRAFSKPKLSGKNAKTLRFQVILGGFSIKQYDQPNLETVI